MFGLLLISLGTLLVESASSFAKYEISKKEEGVFTMGFLNSIFVLIFLLLTIPFGQSFFFNFESLPTFLTRVFFEITNMTLVVYAIARADRSTFSYLRTITIPLLLCIDILLLGYEITLKQLVGVFIILLVIFIAKYRHILNKSGFLFSLLAGVNAAITISLFKYDITHYNSIVAEQSIVLFILLIYLFIAALYKKEGNPIMLLKRKKFLLQSSAVGVGGLMDTFAYLYAPASIITTAKRAAALIWSTLAGWKFFGEEDLIKKLFITLLLIIGIYLLI